MRQSLDALRHLASTLLWLFAGALILVPGRLLAQEAAAPPVDATALAKQSQNPVGSLVSVPFQFNFNTGGDLGERTFLNVNVQPVIPFRVTDRWNVIARTIVPLDSVPGDAATRFSGVGDIQLQMFVTPAVPPAIIWGLGAAFSFPTATIDPLQTGTWAAGPSLVLVKITRSFVLGGLVSQLWPLADAGGAPETNLLTIQPAVNFNFGHGWAIAFSPVIIGNWDAPAADRWTVPVGLGLTRTVVFNRRPMNVGMSYYYNLERPTGTAGAVVMIGIGITAMILATIGNRRSMRALRAEYGAHPLLACHCRGRPDWDPGHHSAPRRLVPNVAGKRGTTN